MLRGEGESGHNPTPSKERSSEAGEEGECGGDLAEEGEERVLVKFGEDESGEDKGSCQEELSLSSVEQEPESKDDEEEKDCSDQSSDIYATTTSGGTEESESLTRKTGESEDWEDEEEDDYVVVDEDDSEDDDDEEEESEERDKENSTSGDNASKEEACESSLAISPSATHSELSSRPPMSTATPGLDEDDDDYLFRPTRGAQLSLPKRQFEPVRHSEKSGGATQHGKNEQGTKQQPMKSERQGAARTMKEVPPFTKEPSWSLYEEEGEEDEEVLYGEGATADTSDVTSKTHGQAKKKEREHEESHGSYLGEGRDSRSTQSSMHEPVYNWTPDDVELVTDSHPPDCADDDVRAAAHLLWKHRDVICWKRPRPETGING